MDDKSVIRARNIESYRKRVEWLREKLYDLERQATLAPGELVRVVRLRRLLSDAKDDLQDLLDEG